MMMMTESCILCEYHQLDPKGNPGKTSNHHLKTLFQFLNVNVVGRRRATCSMSVFVEEEGEEVGVGWIASKICEDCAIVVNGFGTMAESFDKLFQNFLEQWIRKLDSTPSASPGNGLRAEILRTWKLKLSPAKSNGDDEQLSREQEDHDDAPDEERPTTRNHVNWGSEEKAVVAPPSPPQEWRTLNCKTSSDDDDDARQVHHQSEKNTTFSRPRDDVARLPDDGGLPLQLKDLSSPTTVITSLPMPTTPSTTSDSRTTCPYPNCGIKFFGPKSSKKKHYTCVHTVEHFPVQFLGFSQKDVNELTRGICSQEFSQDLILSKEEEEDELNTFKCPFCAATGIKDTDKAFHILEQHQEVVKSRLEARRTEGQMEELEEDMDECHDMEEDQLDDDEDVDGGAQKDEAAADCNLEQEDDGPPKLEMPSYTCGYCELRLYSQQADDLIRHMICNHTVAYFTRRGKLPRSTTEDDVDRVILGLRQQGLLSDPDKQDTFTCSFCQQPQSITGDKKYHLLEQHLNLVQSGLKDIGKVGLVAAAVVPNNSESEQQPPSLPLTLSQHQLGSIKREVVVVVVADLNSTSTPVVAAADSPAAPPDVEEIQTTRTEQMRRRQRDKADFDQNREALMVDTVTKPRFTLIFLIQRAIADSPNRQLKAKEICSWIRSNVGYYRNQRRAKALRTTVPSTLSRSKCFMPLDPLVKDGAWKVKGREFYKCGRKWSSKSGVASSSTSVTTTAPTPVAVNVKIEDLEGDSSIPQSSSTQNEQLAPPLPPPQGNLDLGERPGGSSRNKVVEVGMGNHRRPRPRERSTTSTRGRNCDFCGKWISGPNANLERHNMCTHSTRYFSQHLRPGTSQEEVNRAVASLSGGDGACSGAGVPVPTTRNFDNALASADLLGIIHIKQERI